MKLTADANQVLPVKTPDGVERRVLTYGDGLMLVQFKYVPPNVKHNVVTFASTVLIDAFAPMRKDFLE